MFIFICLFKSIMPSWCYLSCARFKSGFTPKFGVTFGVTPEFTPDFRCYVLVLSSRTCSIDMMKIYLSACPKRTTVYITYYPQLDI